MPEAESKIRVLGENGLPIEQQVLEVERQPFHIEAWNGVAIPLKFQAKGEAIPGPCSIAFYLNVVAAPAPPAGDATISASQPLMAAPLPQGYNFMWSHPPNDGETLAANAPEEMKAGFLVGSDEKNPGNIPAGVHEVGVRVFSRGTVIYQNIMRVNVKP